MPLGLSNEGHIVRKENNRPSGYTFTFCAINISFSITVRASADAGDKRKWKLCWWPSRTFSFFFLWGTQLVPEELKCPKGRSWLTRQVLEARSIAPVKETVSWRSLHLDVNRLTVNRQDLWLAKDNRFLNPKISYERILMAPPCRLISFKETIIIRADMFGSAINRILSLGEIHSWDSISCCLRIFS